MFKYYFVEKFGFREYCIYFYGKKNRKEILIIVMNKKHLNGMMTMCLNSPIRFLIEQNKHNLIYFNVIF